MKTWQRVFIWVCIVASGCNCSSGSNAGSSDSSPAPGTDTETETGTAPVSLPWRLIQPGTFRMGSPPNEPCRGGMNEEIIERVTLTYPFVMSATEVTQQQWEAAGFKNPSYTRCPTCPVNMVNWWEALAFANEMSRREGLKPCYELQNCTGTFGGGCENGRDACAFGYTCQMPAERFESYWECPGYRLPTMAEWEYAARAGTQTATYKGDIPSEQAGCESLPIQDSIEWHCGISNVLRPSALLEPNDWGLFDMLGNSEEWTSSITDGMTLGHGEQDLTNPDPFVDGLSRATKGWSAISPPCIQRAAANVDNGPEVRTRGAGFRLVRTILDPNEQVKTSLPEPGSVLASGPKNTTAPTALTWVSIPAGSFTMGGGAIENELPAHEVSVPAFELTKSEVTVAQYRACVDAGKCPVPKQMPLCNALVEGREAHPFNCASWDEAFAFCQWSGARLPSESEWEYAATRTRNAKYVWGDEAPTCQRTVMNESGIYGCGAWGTAEPCTKTADTMADGVCDMNGNVSEWVQDTAYETYENHPTDGSAMEATSPAMVSKRIRGGTHEAQTSSYDIADDLRLKRRDGAPHFGHYIGTGFRCAR